MIQFKVSNRSQLSAIRRKYCGDWLFYRSGEILGLLNPKFVSDERFLVELPLQPSRENIHGEILKDSKSVLVYLELEKELFVKFYRPRNLARAIRYSFFRRKRSSNSLITALNLARIGIDTPQVAGIAELEDDNGVYSGDYLITENISSKVCFLDKRLPEILQLPSTRFQQFIAALSGMTAQLHNNGIYHGDLSLRNIYCRSTNIAEKFAAAQFGLIDLDGAENHLSPLSLTARRSEAARIISSFVKLAGFHQINLSRPKLTECFTANYFEHTGVELNGRGLEKRIDYLIARKR